MSEEKEDWAELRLSADLMEHMNERLGDIELLAKPRFYDVEEEEKTDE